MLGIFRPGEHIVLREELAAKGNRATVYCVHEYRVGRTCRYYAPMHRVGNNDTFQDKYKSITDLSERSYVGEDALREYFPELCI